MTTAELPRPMVEDDPIVQFKSALAAGDPTAKKLADEFARGYSNDIREMDAAGEEEEMITQKHLSYWRYCVNPRCPQLGHRSRTNWIYPGPARKGPFADIQADQFKKVYHAESLEDPYGAYKINHYEENGLRSTGSFDPNHPEGVYETLLRLPGGILEFPLEQFLTYRWHHNPRLLSGRPDAQAWIAEQRENDASRDAYGEIPCELGCADRAFLTQAEYNNHQEGAHKEHKASVAAARETGKAISQSMDKLAAAFEANAGKGEGGNNDAVLTMMMQLIQNQNEILAKFGGSPRPTTPAKKGD